MFSKLNGMNTHPHHRNYDVVIVGARAAGASTAMLLADAGLRVLAIDRQTYGSETLSTHALMRGAVRRLARWGLLDDVMLNTPTIERTVFTYGDETLSLDVAPEPGIDGLAAPRRTVLDPILVHGARAAGAEVLHQTTFNGLICDPNGRVRGLDIGLATDEELFIEAGLVVGADGLRSAVARSVGAPITHQGQHASAYAMRYYKDLGIDRGAFHWLYREGMGGGVIPTSDGATCVFTAMPQERFRSEARLDVAATHDRIAHELDPILGSAMRHATSVGPVRTFPGVVGQFRKPFGPGWALVGDAGYFKDPFAAHGITDAFRDAELLTAAILANDFAGYEETRNELSIPLFAALDQICSYEWDLSQLKGLHRQLSSAMKAEERDERSAVLVS